MKMISSTALIIVWLTLAATIFARPNDRNADVSKVSEIGNHLGDDLLTILGFQEGNLFYSPSSISTVLSVLYIGARGKTRQELARIGYGDFEEEGASVRHSYREFHRQLQRDSGEYKLEVANALLTQANFPILDEYKDTLESYYGALLKEVDFLREKEEAVEEVNSWVREKTHGKITKLLDDLDESTRLVLLNAIYFKGTWQTEFDPEKTKLQPFYNNGKGSPKYVETMHIENEYPYLYDEERRLRALQLPYKGEDISMVVVLPHNRNGINTLQDELSRNGVYDILSRLKRTKVTVALPKFKLEYYRSLREDLSSSGISSLFESSADLSGITVNGNLRVSDIIHKAMLEVNEEGSEAAAVTSVIVVGTSLQIPFDKNEFKADHPFIVYIIDNRTKTNLFVGRISEL